MKKKSLIVFLILVMLTAVVFTAVACDNKNNQDVVSLSFDESTGAISWYSKDADKYILEIYEKGKDEPIFSLEFSSAAANTMSYTTAGEYKVVLTAYSGDEIIAVTELDIIVSDSIKKDESKPSDNDEIDPDSDLDEPVKILKSNYYYKKSDGGNLSIRLANTSGVKSVSAFDLIRSVWSYNSNDNTLVIDSSYFKRFSVGAKLDMKIRYNDLEESDVNLQVVNVLPLDVIGGEDGVIEVDTSKTALNSRISLGYNGKTLQESASKIVQRVCIDGKKRATTDYITETGKATVSLYYAKVLSSLSAGLHYVEIYTTYGKSEVWLNVSNGRKNFPYNVQIDFDSSYPNIFITWDIYNQNAESFIVEIGKKSYSSEDYPNLFDGNKFDASGKIDYLDSVVVKAVFDGKAQYSDISRTTLNVNISSAVIQSYLSYERSFEFLGERNNYYINDFDEFFDMIYYGLLFYDELDNSNKSGYEKKITFYPNLKAITNVDNSFTQVVNMLNEAVKSTRYTEKLSDNSGVYTIHLTVQSSFVPDTMPDVSAPPINENNFQDTHFSATGRPDDYDDFAINRVEKEASVRLSEELYLAVERGIRPVPVAGSSAYTIYENAKQVLRHIIDDSMNDYQKVHAMYDWLGKMVTYDWDIGNKMKDENGKNIPTSSDEYNKFYKYRQFYLEGVFIDGVAVCNGIAKAMSLMCGIEGIPCYKIKGSSRGSAHAWTKIKVDGNWYVVDATWANRTYTNSYTQTKREILAHYTIFMSEQSSGNTYSGAHYESYKGMYSDYYAGENYNVFANTFFAYNSNFYDYVIDSSDELYTLIDYYKDQCGSNQFITIDVSCDLSTLRNYLGEVKANFNGYNIDVTDYNGAMSGVSSVIISKR